MNNRQRLALHILEWHRGSETAMYNLGSSWFYNHEISTEVVYNAIREIERTICDLYATKKEIVECKSLRNKIVKTAGCVFVLHVSEMDYKELLGVFATSEQVDDAILDYKKKYKGNCVYWKVLLKVGEGFTKTLDWTMS